MTVTEGDGAGATGTNQVWWEMRSKKIISRLKTLVLGFLACLLLAVLAPLFFERRPSDEFAVSSVIASPRDLHVVTAPVRLSEAPDLTLHRGVLYAYGTVATGAPISNIVLDGPVFTLNASGLRASPGFESGLAADQAALGPLVEHLMGLGFDLLTIRRGTLHVTRADGGSETISDIQAELTGRKKGQIASRGSFTVRGQRLAFDATLAPSADKRASSRLPLKASLKGSLLDVSFDGHLDVAEDLQFAGQSVMSTPSLRRAARWFGLPLATAEGLNSVAIRSRFTWARRTLAFEDAKIAIDGNEATGTLTLNMAGERPLIDGTLDFTSALDLTSYVEATRSPFFMFDFPAASWSSIDLSFPLIKHVDADLRISSPKVALKGYVFGHGAATVSVQAGKLQADIVELEVNGGKATAQVTADASASGPRFALRGKIENLDANSATAHWLGAAMLNGRATLALELAGAGSTPSDLVRGLSGKAALTMPEGGRLALDLKALRGAAKADESLGWGLLGKGQTSVEPFEVRAQIVDGMAFLESTQARSGTFGLVASGRIALGEGNLDLRLGVKPNVAADRPLTAADVEAAELVSVRGPWHEPLLRGEARDAGAAAPAAPK